MVEILSFEIAHSTLKCCWWASPVVAIMAYRGSVNLRLWRYSCRRVFGSLPRVSVSNSWSNGVKRVVTTFLGHCETAIEVNCSKQSLQCIGEYRRASFSATLDFPLAESYPLTQFKLSCHFSESLLIDQIGPHSRQIAFGKIGKMPKSKSGDCAVEHTVTKKFEALVVRQAMTAMSQRLTQQLGPVEDVADLPAKRIIVHIQKNRQSLYRIWTTFTLAFIQIDGLSDYSDYSMDSPIRLRSLKFHQIMNAFPTMFFSGTKPQYRLSLLLSRLSPIVK